MIIPCTQENTGRCSGIPRSRLPRKWYGNHHQGNQVNLSHTLISLYLSAFQKCFSLLIPRHCSPLAQDMLALGLLDWWNRTPKINFLKNISFAALGLGCSVQASPQLWRPNLSSPTACKISVPQPGIDLSSPALGERGFS